MAHITALALVPAAPPGFSGAMAWSPSHACAPEIMGILGRAASPTRLDRWLIVRRPSQKTRAQGGTELRRAGG